MKHVDLFSGIGGFALAARWAGFQTVAFCEIDPYCKEIIKERFGAVADREGAGRKTCSSNRMGIEQRKTYQQKTPAHCDSPRLYSDIRSFDGTAYRGAALLTGGFPCQPFSQAGKRRGKEDDRYLWPEMLRVISQARPAWVLGENVAGIVNMELDRVLSDLEGEGYSVQSLVIPACAVDAKHRRDRVWIVGHRDGAGQQQRWGAEPIREAQLTAQWSSKDVADAECDGCGRCSEQQDARGTLCKASQAQGEESELRRTSKTVDCCRPRIYGDIRTFAARWELEPDMGRVAHGIPARMDRLKGLGNAIVPQVAYQIIKMISQIQKGGGKRPLAHWHVER